MFVAEIISSSKEQNKTLKFILNSLKQLIDFFVVSIYLWW